LPKKLVVRSLGELGIVRQLDKGTRGHSMVDQRRAVRIACKTAPQVRTLFLLTCILTPRPKGTQRVHLKSFTKR